MSANIIKSLLRPTISASGDTVSFECKWNNSWDGGEEFKNMDCVWFLNGRQYESHHGEGEMESDTYTIQRFNQPTVPCLDVNDNAAPITDVYCEVRGVYEGIARWGAFHRSPTLRVLRPFRPTVEVTTDKSGASRKVKVKVTASKEDDQHSYECERYRLYVGIEGLPDGRSDKAGHFYVPVYTRESSYEWERTITDLENMVESSCEFFEIRVSAAAQGVAGTSDYASASYVIAHPKNPEITSIDRTDDEALVRFKVNADSYHPVDSVVLQRLKGTEASTPKDAIYATDAQWTDVKTSDSLARVLCDALSSALPTQRERYTYYRIKVERDGHESYSVPKYLPGSYMPAMSITADAPFIFGAISGTDGETVQADIAWRADNIANADQTLKDIERKTQISWGKSKDSWQSTEGVKTFDIDWENPEFVSTANSKKPSGQANYGYAARVFINGLTEGDPIFMKARRVFMKDGKMAADPSPWSNMETATPVSAPAWVNLQAPSFIARGQSIPCTWTFGSDAAQTGWAITDESGKGYASGSDANGYTVIPASAYGNSSQLRLRVAVTTGGMWVYSGYVTVTIADAPTCTVSVDDTLTSKPLVIEASTDSGSVVNIAIVSRGVAYERPDGTTVQYAGDIIWSGAFSPDADGTMSVSDAPFVNGCSYDVRAEAVDQTTKLRSEVATDSFMVDWDSAPALPEATIETDKAARTATISVEGDESCTCSIYRLTQDGASLIADGVAFGSTVTDRFAPYSARLSGCKLAYRIATVTPDGDYAWTDVPYELRGNGITLDWGNRSVRLPFNNEISEQVEKAFEARTHIDGTTDGYWDKGAVRTASASTALIKLRSAEERALVREVAKYPGAVFVRTSSGLAFDADVQVGDIEESYSSAEISLSLDITEIRLTDEHKCGLGDVDG